MIRPYLDTLEKFWYYMPPASVYGQRGIPDFVCCDKGMFIAIEAKSPRKGAKGLTPLQLIVRRNILTACGKHFVVHDEESLEKFKTYIKR